MNETIDLDAEAIWHDERWYTQVELAEAIKTRLEKGDFAVAAHSAALERLHQAVARARVVAFRLDADMADALGSLAQRQHTTPGNLLRQAVAAMLAPVQAMTLTASPEEHANAVALVPKAIVRPTDEGGVESSWFQKGG